MRKKFLSLGVILALFGILALLGGCSTATTTTNTTTTVWGKLYMANNFHRGSLWVDVFLHHPPSAEETTRNAEDVTSLQIGDNVITNGGIYGKIQNIYSDSFILKTDSGDTIRIAKWAVVGKQDETIKPAKNKLHKLFVRS